MLLAIRDRITGIVAWVICIIIIVPFAFFGIQEYVGLGSQPAAIEFNDAEVSMNEFERRMQINRQQLAERFGGTIPEFLDNSDTLRQQTIRQFVDRQALVQYIDEQGYGSSADAVYNSIAAMPQFQEDGKFSVDTYNRQIALSPNFSKTSFEQQVGLDIAIQQLQQGILNTAVATDKQLADYVNLRDQLRDIEYFQFNIDDYKKQVNLSDDEINTYYESNKASLLTERQVAIDYLELDAAEIANTLAVDDATLRDLYDNDQIPGVADKPESRQASHILLLLDESASDDEVAAKQAQIEEIRQRALTEDLLH